MLRGWCWIISSQNSQGGVRTDAIFDIHGYFCIPGGKWQPESESKPLSASPSCGFFWPESRVSESEPFLEHFFTLRAEKTHQSAKHWMREIMDHVHDFTVKYKITPTPLKSYP